MALNAFFKSMEKVLCGMFFLFSRQTEVTHLRAQRPADRLECADASTAAPRFVYFPGAMRSRPLGPRPNNDLTSQRIRITFIKVHKKGVPTARVVKIKISALQF